jgi:hypothetical protein
VLQKGEPTQNRIEFESQPNTDHDALILQAPLCLSFLLYKNGVHLALLVIWLMASDQYQLRPAWTMAVTSVSGHTALSPLLLTACTPHRHDVNTLLGSTGIQTQGFVLASHEPSHLSHTSSPFYPDYFCLLLSLE